METDENFKVREAKLCEINSKFNIIIDLLIRKGMISKEALGLIRNKLYRLKQELLVLESGHLLDEI